MSAEFSKTDLEANRFKAGLGYFVFFLPLLLCRDSKLGRHCANQGLLLWIASILIGLLLGIFTGIPLLGWVFRLAGRLIRFVLFVVALLCFLQLMTNDRAPEIPFIGIYRIIR